MVVDILELEVLYIQKCFSEKYKSSHRPIGEINRKALIYKYSNNCLENAFENLKLYEKNAGGPLQSKTAVLYSKTN